MADVHPGGEPGPGDQLATLTDLLSADVQSDDLAVDARGDSPRRLADAATDVQHPRPRPDPGQLADQVGVGIQRLREGLPAVRKEPQMKTVAENSRPSSVIKSK